MIRTVDLSYAYPGEDPVLHAVSLVLEPGSLTVLAGTNGSGKSTLLALLAGLYEPVSGGVSDAEGGTLSWQDLRGLSRMVLQDADAQILGATVGEDLCLGLARDDDVGREQARETARLLGLAEHWERPVQALSWGMKRKLCLASAMVEEPRLLLLDEPMSGLDYPAVGEMRGLLRANQERGVTQVVSSHDLEPLADLADSLAVLDKGRLALFGPPAEVLNQVREHGVRPPSTWLAGQGLRPWEGG